MCNSTSVFLLLVPYATRTDSSLMWEWGMANVTLVFLQALPKPHLPNTKCLTLSWANNGVTDSLMYMYALLLLSLLCFFTTLAGKSHRRHASPKEGAVAGDGASSPEAAVAPPIEERRRPGYCECCSVRYRDLSLVS